MHFHLFFVQIKEGANSIYINKQSIHWKEPCKKYSALTKFGSFSFPIILNRNLRRITEGDRERKGIERKKWQGGKDRRREGRDWVGRKEWKDEGRERGREETGHYLLVLGKFQRFQLIMKKILSRIQSATF